MRVFDNLFASKAKQSNSKKSDTDNDFNSDSLEIEENKSQSYDMSVDDEGKRLGTIRESYNSYNENSQGLQRNPNGTSCNCQPSVLIVDDTEFNIIPVEKMLKTHFNIDADKASNGQIAVDMVK